MALNRLVWTRRSQQHLSALYRYISKDSQQNALKVVSEIVAAEKATPNPEYYGPDKYKSNNDGSYPAFEKHRYCVVYRYQKNIVRVLRVRHTSMEPKRY